MKCLGAMFFEEQDYFVNNFPGTSVDFHFKKFTQEIISSYVDPCPQNLQL